MKTNLTVRRNVLARRQTRDHYNPIQSVSITNFPTAVQNLRGKSKI